MFPSSELKSPTHLMKTNDDDFCVMSRINSSRNNFAQRHLFKSGIKRVDLASGLLKSKSV